MISLNDIKNYEFKRGIGYSKKSVEEFKTEVISAYDEVCKENIELKDKMTALSEGLQYYKSIEKTLQKALVLAQKTSDEEQEKAEKNARIIEKEAHSRADEVLTKAKSDLDTIFRQTDDLNRRFELYKVHVKNLITTQLELINSDAYNISVNDLEGYLRLKEKLEDAKDIDPENVKAGEMFKSNKDEVEETVSDENEAGKSDASEIKAESSETEKIDENEVLSKETKTCKTEKPENKTEETKSEKVNFAPIKESLISRIPDETEHKDKSITRSLIEKGEMENQIKRTPVNRYRNGESGYEQKVGSENQF